MESVDPLRFILAFVFVIGLIGLCAYGLKRYSRTPSGKFLLGQALLNPSGEGRLQIVESRYLDARRKLVLVRRDEMEHLLLLSDKGEIVVESWGATMQDKSHDTQS